MDRGATYLLLTPGPLSTSRTVKEAMLFDQCTWDRDYNTIVDRVRSTLVELAHGDKDYTCALMQGSGTFSVEATIGSAVPQDGKLLVVTNGAYGARIADIARRLNIPMVVADCSELEPADPQAIERLLQGASDVTHLAMVHCETTTGLLNPAEEVGEICRRFGVSYILDAMSSFGGMPLAVKDCGADFLVSSSNKCIQGVPGFGFVVAKHTAMELCRGRARSLSLDLYDQWKEMDEQGGKWRYTSPTHVVLAFEQALHELVAEGGVAARARRYDENHTALVDGMRQLGFHSLIAPEHQSSIITSFLYPADPKFSFQVFYEALKTRGFVIYPGKVTQADTFRIGTIGHVFPSDIRSLIAAVGESIHELGIEL